MRIGDVHVLIETSRMAGTEATSRAGDAAQRVVDAFAEVERAIAALSRRVSAMAQDLGTPAGRLSSLEVELGLKVTTEGRVVIAAASAEASLTVRLSYEGPAGDGERQA